MHVSHCPPQSEVPNLKAVNTHWRVHGLTGWHKNSQRTVLFCRFMHINWMYKLFFHLLLLLLSLLLQLLFDRVQRFFYVLSIWVVARLDRFGNEQRCIFLCLKINGFFSFQTESIKNWIHFHMTVRIKIFINYCLNSHVCTPKNPNNQKSENAKNRLNNSQHRNRIFSAVYSDA